MRTFIAIELDEAIKDGLLQLIRALQEKGKNVRWVNRNGLHLTLKFLGEISEEQGGEVKDALRRISLNHHLFPLRLKGTGYFPPERKSPRVLWAGVQDGPELNALQEDLEQEMERIGFTREQRKFHPHLTLGRVKFPSGLSETLRELEQQRDNDFGEMLVRKITFFQSILKPTGAEYAVVSEERLL